VAKRRPVQSRWFRRRTRRREKESEGGTFADFAIHHNPALVLLNDAVDGGQPEAGAFAGFLGGEKGFEQMAQGRAVHATAGIGGCQTNKIAGARLGIQHGRHGIEGFGEGAKGESPSVAHGVAGVEAKIQSTCSNIPTSA